MGMKAAAPWWLTWALAGGVLGVFFGERVLGDVAVGRAVLTGGGTLVLLGATAWRAWSWRRATAEARFVELMLLVASVGVVIAVLGLLAGSEDGMSLLGIEVADPQSDARLQTVVQILSVLLLTISLLPALAGQWALMAHRHAGSDAVAVESLRIRQTAVNALTVALAGGFLLLAGYVASERDQTIDLSYFKTSAPGTATQNLVRSMSGTVRVLLFFPDVNPVKDEVLGYFRSLANAVPNLEVETIDRMTVPQVAREYRVREDGAVILEREGRTERLMLPTELNAARNRLRRFDRDVQERLHRLARGIRMAYFTVGHGELGDQVPGDTTGTQDPFRTPNALKGLLQLLNYSVQPLGLREGLGNEIPEDAAVVFVLGPRRPFLTEELDAVDRYIAGGGSVLLALEPESEFQLGPLAARLGLEFRDVVLADDRQHLRRRGNVSDRQLIVTDRFSAHEAVTTLSRSQVGSGIVFLGAGYLEARDPASVRRSFVVRSLASTFADANRNFQADGGEARNAYNLVAAVEALPDTGAVGDTEPASMRALVYSDADMFSDGVLQAVALNAALVADGVRWLGREEETAGAIESEEDVAIVHTRTQDVVWFYSTIVGAPAAVLVFGMIAVFRRRRRGRRV